MREPHIAHAHIHTHTYTHARTHTRIYDTRADPGYTYAYTLVVIATAFNHVSQAARRRQASRRRSSATSYIAIPGTADVHIAGTHVSFLLRHTLATFVVSPVFRAHETVRCIFFSSEDRVDFRSRTLVSYRYRDNDIGNKRRSLPSLREDAGIVPYISDVHTEKIYIKNYYVRQ